MTKAIIDLDKLPETVVLYRTKEEWDNSYHSQANYNKVKAEREQTRINYGVGIVTGLVPFAASNEPERFPCLAIEGNVHYKSDSVDQIEYLFLYDFTIEEVAPKEVTPALTSRDKEFTVYWRDGKRSVVKGPSVEVAFARAGYSAGAVAAIDWYDNGDIDTHNWASETRTWIRKTPMLQS